MLYVRRMRDLREDNDLTQQQVANFLGTSQTMYARYERGANELPIRHLLKLCELYKVSSDYILGLTDDRKRSNQRRGEISTIDYSPLWETLRARSMSETQLQAAGIDRRVLDSLSKGKSVSLNVIERLCRILDCTPNDIVRFIED